MAIRRRKPFVFGGVAALVVAATVGALGLAASNGRAETPAPAAVASEVPGTPTIAPTPAPIVTNPYPVEVPMAVPFGPVRAEPYRVHTGDGDCLNVRPVPGTTFKSDPRTCVPEGFLLWIYGAETEVDGHKWRYALGEGWVAVQYIVPAPGAATGFGPFSAVTVSAQAGEVTKLARVAKDGSITALPTVPDAIQGLGDSAPAQSPDGKWVAYGKEIGYVPTLTIRNMATGEEARYPQAHPAIWSPNGRLLVRVSSNCPQQCTWKTAWIDPNEGLIRTVSDKPNSMGNIVWANDGQSLYGNEDGALVQLQLNGDRREIVAKSAGNEIPWGQLSLSADGKKLLSSPFQGAITVVDLQTGALSKVERAAQILTGGRCGGGGGGALTTWLDANTVIWHESYAEKGGNGITISSINGGARRLIPFFTVADIRTVAPSLVSFSTWEDPSQSGNGAFQLTWLLDTNSGEARPVTVGATPTWQ